MDDQMSLIHAPLDRILPQYFIGLHCIFNCFIVKETGIF